VIREKHWVKSIKLLVFSRECVSREEEEERRQKK